MVRLLVPVVCALALIASVAPVAAEDFDESDVLVLTTSNFDDIVNEEETMLVEFYAPWCGHCKRLAPNYAAAATRLLQNDPPVKLAKVDATEENDLAQRFEVRGYPTLKVFHNGQPSDYGGGRDEEAIVSYMKKQSGPAAKPVSSKADVEKFTKSGEGNFWVLGVFGKDTTPLHAAFVLTANKMRDDFTFLKSSNTDLLAAYGVSGQDEAIIALKTFDDKQTVYEGSTKKAELEQFIIENSLAVVGEYTPETAKIYAKRGLPVAKLFVKVDWSTSANTKATKYFVNRLKKSAAANREKIVFALADTTLNAKEMEQLGISDKTSPLIIEDGKAKYLMQEDFNAKNVAAFVKSFLDGEAERHIKSEPVPEKNDGPVSVVVGKTFDDLVMDPEKDVLIEFYAPWCGHCKKLEPIYKKLGKKMRKYDTVRIAKMDATANDVPPEFDVSGFPTIYMVQAKKNAKPIRYSGQRELDDFVDFIKSNAKSKLKKSKKKSKK